MMFKNSGVIFFLSRNPFSTLFLNSKTRINTIYTLINSYITLKNKYKNTKLTQNIFFFELRSTFSGYEKAKEHLYETPLMKLNLLTPRQIFPLAKLMSTNTFYHQNPTILSNQELKSKKNKVMYQNENSQKQRTEKKNLESMGSK